MMAERIVIAVDFGTTYSAVGYARYTDGIDLSEVELHIVEDGWPDQGNRRSPKIPTVFKVEGGIFRYGFEVEFDDDRVAFSKLFLDPLQGESAEELARCTNTEMIRNNQRLVDGVSKYLEALRLRALDHMVTSSGWTEAYVRSTPKEYVLSVPALWSDRARDKTLDCAYRAGYGQRFSPSAIKLVTEPEAAASYTITTQLTQAFKNGDAFVVCDAGGGTVDLAAYEITRPMPHLELDEVTVSQGALQGSVYLDQAFLSYVEEIVGQLPIGTRNTVLTEFREDVGFTGEEENLIFIDSDLPENPNRGFEGGSLTIPSDDLQRIFDGVIGNILRLLTEQLDDVDRRLRDVERMTVILVGGFGSSGYLMRKVAEGFPLVNVIQPPDSWTAVIRGALLRGIIRKRKIRCAYGVCFKKRWRPELEREGEEFRREHRVWDNVKQKWYCNDCVQWYVRKGEEFTASKTVEFPFYRAVGIGHNMKFTDILYVYRDGVDGDVGPEYLDLQCEPYHRLTTDLAAMIPDIKLRLQAAGMRKRNDRGSYYEVNFKIGMTFDNEIKFYLIFEDQRQQIEVEYVEPQSMLGVSR